MKKLPLYIFLVLMWCNVENSEDENYLKFLQKINSLNKVVTQIDKNQKLIEFNEMIEIEKKEFVSIEKKLKS